MRPTCGYIICVCSKINEFASGRRSKCLGYGGDTSTMLRIADCARVVYDAQLSRGSRLAVMLCASQRYKHENMCRERRYKGNFIECAVTERCGDDSADLEATRLSCANNIPTNLLHRKSYAHGIPAQLQPKDRSTAKQKNISHDHRGD
jgi:hypothetical protein